LGRLESSEREQLWAFWREHLDGWRRSNLTQREYCAANGLSLKRFGNWEYVRMSKLAIRVYDTYEDIVDAGCTTWNDLLAMQPKARLHHRTRLGQSPINFVGWYKLLI